MQYVTTVISAWNCKPRKRTGCV